MIMFLATYTQLAQKVLRDIEKDDGASNKFRFSVEGETGDSRLDAEKAVADLKEMALLDPKTFHVSAKQYGDTWCVRISWQDSAQGNPPRLDPAVMQSLRERAQSMFTCQV